MEDPPAWGVGPEVPVPVVAVVSCPPGARPVAVDDMPELDDCPAGEVPIARFVAAVSTTQFSISSADMADVAVPEEQGVSARASAGAPKALGSRKSPRAIKEARRFCNLCAFCILFSLSRTTLPRGEATSSRLAELGIFFNFLKRPEKTVTIAPSRGVPRRPSSKRGLFRVH